MTKEQEYEMLKARMVKAYAAYINAVQESNYSNLNTTATKQALLDIYIKTVDANTA